jgi:hypothetical protein
MSTVQAELFDDPRWPGGLRYLMEFVSRDEELSLLDIIRTRELRSSIAFRTLRAADRTARAGDTALKDAS